MACTWLLMRLLAGTQCAFGVPLFGVVVHDGPMDRDWTRLGRAIQKARRALGLSQLELAARAGVSRSTIQYLERGRTPQGRPPTSLPAIERALGWPPDTALPVTEGADAPQPQMARPGQDVLASRLPAEISQRLADAEVVGVDVVDLTRAGEGRQMIVLVTRDEEEVPRTPEEIRAELEEWNRMRRGVRELAQKHTE